MKQPSRKSSKGTPAAAGQPGLVVAAYGRRGELATADGRRLPCLAPSRGLRFVCGDRVTWEPGGDGEALILGIGARTGLLERQSDRPGRPEPLAANLTHVLVLLAPRPAPDFELADRYLAAARLAGATAAVGWNKSDLAPVLPPELQVLVAAGYPVFGLGARSGEGVAAVRDWIGTGMALVVGQSGVGKSSLLNRLVPGTGSATGELSDATGEGRHTTTATRMFALGGGWLADAPGVRDFAPAIPDPRRVADGFLELARLAGDCRFPDCYHAEEPGCAVKAGVAAGRVDPRRYASYRLLLKAAQAAAAQRHPR